MNLLDNLQTRFGDYGKKFKMQIIDYQVFTYL